MLYIAFNYGSESNGWRLELCGTGQTVLEAKLAALCSLLGTLVECDEYTEENLSLPAIGIGPATEGLVQAAREREFPGMKELVQGTDWFITAVDDDESFFVAHLSTEEPPTTWPGFCDDAPARPSHVPFF